MVRKSGIGGKLLTGLLASSVLAALTLSGCGGGGGGKKPASADPVTEAPVPAETKLRVSLINAATGASIPAGKLKVLADPEGVLDTTADKFDVIAGTLDFAILESKLKDNNKDGTLETPAVIQFSIDAPGYLPTVIDAVVTRVGVNKQPFALVSETAPPEGIAVAKAAVDVTAAESTVVASSAASEKAAEIVLPKDTQLVSDEGKILDNSTLEVVVAGYDAGNPESLAMFPGGFNVTIDNLAELNEGEGETSTDPRVNFVSGGFVTIKVVDGDGNEAKRVLNDGKVSVRIAVAPSVINPETKKPVVAGDSIPYWSFDTDTGTWRYEGRLVIGADESGLFGEFETTHFSSYNLDWFNGEGYCNVSPTIEVVDSNGAVMTTPGSMYITSPGSGYSHYAAYQGDGTLYFYNSPDVPVNMVFTAYYGAEQQLEVVRLENGANRTPIGTVVNGEIRGINLCTLSQPRLVMRTIPRRPIFSAYSSSVVEGNSGMRQIEFTGYLDIPSSSPVSVSYTTVAGTAVAGSDFQPASGTLTFPANVTQASFTVTVLSDTVPEDNEYFTASFSSSQVDMQYGNVIYASISDDDLPAFTLQGATVTERDDGSQTVELKAVFAEQPRQWFQLLLTPNRTASTATEFLDYVAVDNYWTYWYQYSARTQTVSTLTIFGDKDVESAEDVVYDVSVYPDYLSLPASLRQVKVRINDDGDAVVTSAIPSLSVGNPPGFYSEPLVVAESAGTVRQVVRLSQAFHQTVTVQVASSGGNATAGSDYQGVSQTLTFAPGEASKLVSFNIIDDLVTDGLADETFNLVLSNAVNSSIGTSSPRIVSIKDNDIPYVYIYGYVSEDDGVNADAYDYQYVYVWPPAPYPITVQIDSIPGRADIVGLPATVTIPANSYFAQLNLSALDDSLTEGWEYYALTGTVTSGDALIYPSSYVYIPPSDPLPQAYVVASGQNVADEGGRLQFALYLDRPVSRNVTVSLLASPTDARLQLPATVTVPAGQTFVSLTVPITDDRFFQAQKQVCISTTGSQQADYVPYSIRACGTIRASDSTGATGGSN